MMAARLDAWRNSAHALAEHPLRGHGRPLPYESRYKGVYPAWDAMNPAYVGMALTSGLMGLMLLLGLLGLLWRGMQQAARTRVWTPGQAVICQGLLAVVCTLMLLAPVIANPMSAVLLTAVLGLGVGAAVDEGA